jgi:hypothetical protein
MGCKCHYKEAREKFEGIIIFHTAKLSILCETLAICDYRNTSQSLTANMQQSLILRICPDVSNFILRVPA